MQTVKQAADKAFPGITYDYALPQAFFEDCLNKQALQCPPLHFPLSVYI